MSDINIHGRLAFLRAAEQLKDTLRSAHTARGRQESTAEHSWRLTLIAMTFADQWPDIDSLKLLKLCVLHDLGEAIHGDIPAPEQLPGTSKVAEERVDFLQMVQALPAELKHEFIALWDDYTHAQSTEARIVKALDKIETLLQHIQGDNPPDFDYVFNLGYGRQATDAVPLTKALREMLDEETRALANRNGQRVR